MKKTFATVMLTLACSLGAFAQGVAGLGAVTGTVRDSSGAVVPDAAVVIANNAKGIRRTMQTTDAGVFSAPALVPSTGYSITVTKQGFSNWEVKDFQIQVGQTVDFNIALQVAASATQVEITAVAPLVEDTKSGVTQVVTQQQIDDLPINGRRADTFALMTPAVTPDGTFGLISFRGIAAGNLFMTDGNDTTNSFYMENAGRTRISTQISQDAVQEFQVLSDGFSAEFGRAMGGIINTVTRSGTNEYHGTAYEFFRNRTLNATDRYAAGYNPPEWRHQAGATLGGPIKKDKLFFFTNFELVKRNFPGLNRITTSLIADPTGTFVKPSNCGAPATAAQCAAAIAFIQPQMNVLVNRTVDSDIGFAKLDYRPTERNTFTFDLNVMHWRSPHGIQTQGVFPSGAMLGNNGNSTVETRYGKAEWTGIVSASALNELRFGWFKDRLSDPGASDLWPSTGPLYITVAGATVGAAQAYPRTFPSEQRFQIVDNFSWTKGAHSAKFGVDFSTTEDYMNQLFNEFGGYSYSTLSAFAADFTGNTTAKNYSTFTQTFGNPVQDLHTKEINLYAQDTWKVSRRFTVSYGLRWEKAVLPQPTLVDPNYPQTGHINSPNKDFAPRFNVSYMINDRTVLRAGFGLFYEPFIGDGLDTLFLGNGKYQTSISVNPTQSGAPIFPNIVASASSVPAGTVTLNFASNDFHNPYTEQGTVALEHQLTHDLVFTGSYIWTHGVGLWTQRDVNLSGPTATQTYIIDDVSGNQVSTFTTPIWTAASKVDPRYSKLIQVENGGQSWYNGLALQLQKRFSHGVTAQAVYTWSHAIDDAYQQGASPVITWASNNTVYNGNYKLDKGSSALDQRHRATINFLWQPKFTRNTSTFSRFVVNGWELSAITTLASAEPISGTVSVSGTQFASSPLLYTNSINGSGGWGRVPFLPVDSFDIDREYRVDARITRSLPFSERVKGMLIFEAFNAFNTQYNTSINTTAYTASGGVLKPVTTAGTGNQSNAFPDGTDARRCQVAFRLVF